MLSSSLLPVLVGFAAGVCLTLTIISTQPTSRAAEQQLAAAKQTIAVLHQQCSQQSRAQAIGAPSMLPAEHKTMVSVGSAARWTDTADNRRLYDVLTRVANPRREVLLALANDVMMCSNRKTCWWNGGNVLETFLKSLGRLSRNSVWIEEG